MIFLLKNLSKINSRIYRFEYISAAKKQPECGSFTKPIQAAWWEEVDSNHRSRGRQIYSLLPLATREPIHMKFLCNPENGAGDGT